ncbi:MAG: DUF433 domain-containing protein [Chloroflexi bacterium]|nr:DUF433 domain-containing protein [Chloroflexota bacterium]
MATVFSQDNHTNQWRTDPLYTFKEAAHLAHVSSSTVRNWLLGRNRQPPLFSAPQMPMVSFLQLIEIIVAANFRKAERVSYDRVQRAHLNARTIYGLEFPFAQETLEVIGGHIVRRLHEDPPDQSLQALDEPTQWTMPGLVLDVMAQIGYERELAAQWFPAGKSLPIVVDPRVSSGVPTIVGRGVTIQVIHKRFVSGQRLEFIAHDFELEPIIVEEAVRYAERIAA